jgi:hypothetical protein
LGLRIENNVVIVDHSVNEHLETTVSNNPTTDWIDGLPVYGIFQRKFHSAKLSRGRRSKTLGDNCPLIYALKGKDDLTVEFSSIKSLNENIPTIIQNVLTSIGDNFDAVVAMPSSSPLSAILAKRLSRASGRPHFCDMFSKTTNAAAMANVTYLLNQSKHPFPKRDDVDVRNALQFLSRISHELYAAKNIKTHIRKYFTPLAINAVPAQLGADSRILLVDDLLATGETLRAAHAFLVTLGMQGPHVATTWFSKVGKPNRS